MGRANRKRRSMSRSGVRDRRLRLEALEDRRLLATIPVTNLADFGPGSLRQAIFDANNMGGPDTIDLTGIAGTINIALGEMEITDSVTLDGPGAGGLTLDAGQNSRLFNVTSVSADVTIRGLTLTGGRTTGNVNLYSGGAIRSESLGTLTIDQSTIAGNTTEGDFSDGGAIFTSGNLTITGSTVSQNATLGDGAGGGATFAGGTTTITDSVVKNNHTEGQDADGGGVLASGVLLLTRSTISGNTTLGDSSGGGGIAFFNQFGYGTILESTISGNGTRGESASGGGVLVGLSTHVNILQSTFSGNYTGETYSSGGAIFTAGSVTIDRSTITDNHTFGNSTYTGGLWVQHSDPVIITNSIISGNTSDGGSPDLGAAFAQLTLSFSQIGGDAMLGPLADNGGPTRTHVPLPGSPALDSGDPSVTFDAGEFDQRGGPFVRVVDGGVGGLRMDIGAVERQNLSGTLVVDTTVDESDGDYSVGDLSLREAIELANSTNVDTIEFDPVLFATPQTIQLGLGELSIGESVLVDGPGADLLTVDAQQQSRVFNVVTEIDDVTLRGMTITGGRTTGTFIQGGSGGGIRSLTNGVLTIERSRVTGNTTEGDNADGGGIYAYYNLTILHSTISDNSTSGDSASGGGISIGSGTGFLPTGLLTITDSTISGNTTSGANSSGGGIASFGETTITQTTISGNRVTGNSADAGGIFGVKDLLLAHSTIADNHAEGTGSIGGGLVESDFLSGVITIVNSIIANNTAVGGNPDLRPGSGGLSVDYSLIGDTSGLTLSQLLTIGAGSGNIVNVDPLLGPLAYSGGTTETHALLAGSPALDAGDPSIDTAPDEYDQRGDPFLRVRQATQGGGVVIDMGAYERQSFADPSLVVDIALDENDGDYSVGDLSLREALGLANGDLGNNTITFDPSLGGETILLVLGQLDVTDSVTITGLGADQLTVDAQQGSRVVNIDNGNNSQHLIVEISGLTITGGEADQGGAGIRSLERLELIDSVVSGNSATGSGLGTDGGGLYLQTFGGMTVSISGSTIANNSAVANAGGIRAASTIGDLLAIINSTVSGNMAELTGGGIRSTGGGATNIAHSTVAFNIGDFNADNVGGVGGISDTSGMVTFDHTIVGSNVDTTGPEDDLSLGGTFTADYSLFGNSAGVTINGSVNLLNTNPQLAPLADNGGPTSTHSLLPTSLARDSGNFSIVGAPLFDQRGPGFPRIVGTRIDRGALEVQAASADFNMDGVVSGIDFLLWQIGFGTPMPLATKADGDADYDTDTDSNDLDLWELQYGGPPPLTAVSSALPVAETALVVTASKQPASPSDLTDLALAVELAGDTVDEEEPFVDDQRSVLEVTPTPSLSQEPAPSQSLDLTDDGPSSADSDASNDADHAWLTDDLLDLVFG